MVTLLQCTSHTPCPTLALRARRMWRGARVVTACAIAVAFQPDIANAQPKPASITPPVLRAPKPLTLPTVSERTLSNGLRVVVVEQHELPILDATMVFRTGAEADPAGKTGLATLTAGLLTEGAAGRDAAAVAEQIDFLGIRLSSTAGFDQSSVSLHTTRATLDSALALMADVVRRPAFATADFERNRNTQMTSLLQEADRGPAMADRAFNAIVFGPRHPYGNSTRGTREDVGAITRDDVHHFWQTWYRPNNATIIVVGDISVADAVRMVSSAFGSWERAPLPAITKVEPSAPSPTTIYIVDKPNAPQSSFRIGGIGVARNTKDYYPLLVMNTALGGSFTSRLNQNLRETKGYSYGAGSGFAMRREPGPFTAGGEIVAAKTDSALIEFLKELNTIRVPFTAAELSNTKRYLQLGYAEQFESPSDIARQLAALIPSGMPLTTLNAYNAGIGAVTIDDVHRVAHAYIDPAKLAIVVAGDRAFIEPTLKALHIAPVEIRDARGAPILVPPVERPDMLVNTTWLAQHANDADLVVLHVASQVQYDSGHVANARLVTLADVSLPTTPSALSLQMASAAHLATWARTQGINDRSRIVVVPHDASLQSAARVVLSLAYIGLLDRTAMLDGSFQAWKKEGRAISTASPSVTPSVSLTTHVQPALIATLAQVDAHTRDRATTIIDARLTRFFNGDGGGYPRAGHIPTAVSVPFASLSSDGFIKPVAELRAQFAAAGVPTAKPVVTYCHIGQQASLAWFVSTYLGYQAQLFDGSFQEWSGAPTMPVVGPPDAKNYF